MLGQTSRTGKGKDREESHHRRKSNRNIGRNSKPCIHCMKKKIRCTAIPGKYPSLCVACERMGLSCCKGHAYWKNVSSVIETIGRESDSNNVLQREGAATGETAQQPSLEGTTQNTAFVQGSSTETWYSQQPMEIPTATNNSYSQGFAECTTIGSEFYPQGSADYVNTEQWNGPHTPYFAETFGFGRDAEMLTHAGHGNNVDMSVAQSENREQEENDDQAVFMGQFPFYEPFGNGENNGHRR